jgi:uncharacterized membrane protein
MGGIFSAIDVPFTGVIGTEASGINNRGQIVGSYFDATATHGFLDSGGIFSAIDVPLAGGNTTDAEGINDAGQIVGRYNDVPGPPLRHGFLDNGGIFSPIDVPFPGVFVTQAFGINDAGQIVGTYNDATGNHGFLDAGGSSRRSMCRFRALSARWPRESTTLGRSSGSINLLILAYMVFSPLRLPCLNRPRYSS